MILQERYNNVVTILRFSEKGTAKQVLFYDFARKVQQNRYYFMILQERYKKQVLFYEFARKVQ